MITYVDSSAIVKLFVEEDESSALRSALGGVENLASSVLAKIEVCRAARAVGVEVDAARAALATVSLIPLDEAAINSAIAVDPVTVRSLDSLHLGTALSLGDQLGALITYDARMQAAAKRADIVVLAPR